MDYYVLSYTVVVAVKICNYNQNSTQKPNRILFFPSFNSLKFWINFLFFFYVKNVNKIPKFIPYYTYTLYKYIYSIFMGVVFAGGFYFKHKERIYWINFSSTLSITPLFYHNQYVIHLLLKIYHKIKFISLRFGKQNFWRKSKKKK